MIQGIRFLLLVHQFDGFVCQILTRDHQILTAVFCVFLPFCCSSIISSTRNPTWGEEFNFSVDELPMQVVALLQSSLII